MYARTPDIDDGYWLLVFIVFNNLLAILRLPVLMGEVITVYPHTPVLSSCFLVHRILVVVIGFYRI